ncbi:hypothetical protein D932_00364 [Enterococcus casseliflavus 14-MB-W-14]|nr:hypothetical protein D932_00364 [Enterococcus casseliflavus 14-MB-W-14]
MFVSIQTHFSPSLTIQQLKVKKVNIFQLKKSKKIEKTLN